MTYPCAKGAAVHSILCLRSKLRFYVLGSRARLGDRGQQRKKKEELGRTRKVESPLPGREDAQEDGDGLRAKLSSTQTEAVKGSHTINLPEWEERLMREKLQNTALSFNPNRKEESFSQCSCENHAAENSDVIGSKRDCSAPCTQVLKLTFPL